MNCNECPFKYRCNSKDECIIDIYKKNNKKNKQQYKIDDSDEWHEIKKANHAENIDICFE